MASTNVKVDSRSQERDVGHESPVAEGSESVEKAGSYEDALTTTPANTSNDLQKVRAERDTVLDRLARTQAQLENSRKRAAKEQEDFRVYALSNTMKSLLPILDRFELSLRHTDNADTFRSGVELIYNQLKDALHKIGLQEIPHEGERFDPFLSACGSRRGYS